MKRKYLPITGTTVIGFGGRSRAGKDTAATIIFGVDPLHSHRFAFSDAITYYCRVLHGMKKRDPGLLQKKGLELKQWNNDVWLEALYWRIDEIRPRIALITGLRFPEEIAMVRDMGGTAVWVERVDEDGKPVVATDRDPKFKTETSVSAELFDYTIVNISGREDLLHSNVLTLYATLKRDP